MEATGLVCDRCGDYYTRNIVVPKGRKVTSCIISVGLVDENGVILQVDLCDGCLRRFFDFVGDEWQYLRDY